MNRNLKIQIYSLKEYQKIKEILSISNEPISKWYIDLPIFNNRIIIYFYHKSDCTNRYFRDKRNNSFLTTFELKPGDYVGWNWRYYHSSDIDFSISYTTFINIIREKKLKKIINK